MASIHLDPPRPDPDSLRAACAALPMFPLPGAMLLPGAAMPLHVFEPRYRQLVVDTRDGGFLCIPQLDPDAEGEPAPWLPYACVGQILAHRELSDGRYNILVQPVGRVRIEAELHGRAEPYRMGRAVLLEDRPFVPREMDRVGARLLALVGPLLGGMGERGAELRRVLASMQPARVAEAVAPFVLGDAAERQAYIAEDDAVARAGMVETAVLGVMAGMGAVSAEA